MTKEVSIYVPHDRVIPLLRLTGHIVIKPADKNAGWVIMNSKDYISEMKKQLSATFDDTNGPISFYENATERDLKAQAKEITGCIQSTLI